MHDVNAVKYWVKYFCLLSSLLLVLLFSGCLSLKIALQLPQKPDESGVLQVEYRFDDTLQNISNYPPPRADIAPLPLPLWEGDFRAIAAQSPGLKLLHYSFRPARAVYRSMGPKTMGPKNGRVAGGKNSAVSLAVVKARLGFATEKDLRLLLGPELQWRGEKFRWQLSAAAVEQPDASYPQIDGELNGEEQQKMQQFFAAQTLEITVKSPAGQVQQQLPMVDFLLGRKNINLEITK